MSELLAPPDVEPAVVAVLGDVSGSPWVGTQYPGRPGQEAAGVIRVSATGGPRPVDRVVTEQTVLVECWHDDSNVAWRIAAEAYARLRAATGSTVAGVDIKHVSCTGLNNNPDVNRKELIRFQFMASIHSRLVPLEAS